MDTEHLRTFLEVARSRHFGKAASSLNITQSAVSARIKLLESTLGTELFSRKRNDIQLTTAGKRLLYHAETIVAAWARARQETGMEPEYERTLAIGGIFDLWPILLDEWLAALPGRLSGTVLAAEAHASEQLVRRLIDGALDLVVLFEPPQVPAITARQVGVINLVLVADTPNLAAEEAMSRGYILVDWGTSFASEQAHNFAGLPSPSTRAGLGTIGYALLLEQGGSAYLPAQLVEKDVTDNRLFMVKDAPVFKRPVYALFKSGSDREDILLEAISLLNLP